MTLDPVIKRVVRDSGACLAFAVFLISCGGGPDGTSPPPQPPPPPPPPAQNHAPILSLENATQTAIVAHAFQYDPTQAGAAFTDPDGDELTYDIHLTYFSDASNEDPSPSNGFRVEGNRIVGAPEGLGIVVVDITASDDTGDYALDEFWIEIKPNSAPVQVRLPEDLLLEVGDSVDIEASLNGTAFSDPDGDELTYEVTLRRDAHGLAVTGTRLAGKFDAIGLVEVTVHARDAYGGAGSGRFLIAAPAVEPGSPTLPEPRDHYEDRELALPYVFRDAFDDTTPPENPTTDAGATLGRVLFYDKRLSITNQFSCSSCHHQDRGFASPVRFSTGVLGVELKRQAMPLANVRYNSQHAWFSDMRTRSLEELVLQPIRNPEELGDSVDLVIAKLARTAFYPPLFESAFGTPEITDQRIARALAQFLRSLISYRSRYDLALNPMENVGWQPEAVFNEQEMRGFELVLNGEARCSGCHDLRLSHNIWQANNGLDAEPADPGATDPDMSRGFVGVFRPASLRNIEVSGPYMHDGRFETLRDVINHYDHGIQDSPNLDGLLFGFNGGPMRLNLSEEDKDALESFLRTMTDQEFLTDPKFSNPFVD